MSDILSIYNWLGSYPNWQDKHLVLEKLGTDPGDAGLFYEGLTVQGVNADITGHRELACRYGFTLRTVMYQLGESSQWLEELERWVTEQTLAGATPVLGKCTEPCKIWAQKAALDRGRQTGTAVFTLKLTVEYTAQEY